METVMTAKYPILDTTGKVREWLDAGRGLRVWTNQEIGANRSDQLTPGDITCSPHWAYTLGSSRVLGPDDITFYTKCSGFTRIHSDSPAGWKAAEKECARLNDQPDKEWSAPAGRFARMYTVEPVVLAECEYVDDLEPIYSSDGYRRTRHHRRTRHLEIVKTNGIESVRFQVAVREWIAKVSE